MPASRPVRNDKFYNFRVSDHFFIMADGCPADLGQYIEGPHCSSTPEPRDLCQPLLQENNADPEQQFDEDYEEEDDEDEDEEMEEEEEEGVDEEFGDDCSETDCASDSENNKGRRRSEARKMRKLANLFAMVQSINMQQNAKTRKRRRGASEPVVCDYCPENFVCFASLNTHSKKEHGVNLLQCTECGKDCNSLNLLKVHIKMKHEKKRNDPVVTGRFPCETCGIKYQTESALILHKYKIHHVKLAIICPFCDRVFNRVSNAENLYNHTMKEHQDRKTSPEYINIVNDFLKFRQTSDTFCCKTCNKSFESSYKLKSHQYKVHNEREASFLCDKCDKVFKFRGELNFHYQKYHSGVIFVCPDCGKTFNHKYNLEIHIKMVHVRNKTLSCDLCGKMFFIPSKLEHHRRTVHEKLKPFQCEFCGFRCAAHGNLNLHRKTQHGAEKLTIAEYNKKHGIVTEKKPGGRSHTQTAIAQGIAQSVSSNVTSGVSSGVSGVSGVDLEPQTEGGVKPELQKEEESCLTATVEKTELPPDRVSFSPYPAGQTYELKTKDQVVVINRPGHILERKGEESKAGMINQVVGVPGGGVGGGGQYHYLAPPPAYLPAPHHPQFPPAPPPLTAQIFQPGPAPPAAGGPGGPPPPTEYYLLPNMTPWQTILPAQTNQH